MGTTAEQRVSNSLIRSGGCFTLRDCACEMSYLIQAMTLECTKDIPGYTGKNNAQA